MTINAQKGNMYPFVTHTWNVIKGKCPHDCAYCYMKLYPQKELRLDANELKTDLGHRNYIFVGSSCDMWADSIPNEWIEKTLEHCKNYQNEYLFQSKNPQRFNNVILPIVSVIGTTIESNRVYPDCKAPSPELRMWAMLGLSYPKMINIEPIMDFDLDDMVRWIKDIAPEFVSIGADSKGHKLPEPPPEKVASLIQALKEITTVKLKDNLKRLLSEDDISHQGGK